MNLDAASTQRDVKAPTRANTGVWRSSATLAVGLLILVLPLARHEVVLRRPPFSVYYEFTSFIGYLSDGVVILVLLTWLVWFRAERPETGWGHRAITLPLALLPVTAFATAPWAGDRSLAIYVGLRLVVLLAVYLAITTLQPSPRAIQISLAAGLLLQVAVAVAQFVTQDDLGWRQLGEIELAAAPGKASIITAGDRVWLRGYGLTPHPNILGGILAVMLLALVVPYLQGHGLRKATWLAILVAGAIGLVISFSRAAWLGGAAGGMLLLLGVAGHQPWRRQYGPAFLVPALVGLVTVAGFALAKRDLFIARLGPPTSYEELRSRDERAVLTDKSLDLIRRVPLTGVGAGNFSVAVAPRLENVPATTPQPVHNLPLLLSGELGLAGGAIWVWLMWAPVLLAWRRYRAKRVSLWMLGLTAGLVALAVIDLFDFYSWGWPQGRLLRWVNLGLWSAALDEPAH